MFSSVLIANRGEVAVRIAKTLRRMGIRSVVATSIPDRHSLAVRTADASVLLEGYSAAESYLDIGAVIHAAKAEGCDAIHPGYGFLSERADFAERCAIEGISFIGPPPAVLRGLGDKAAARQLALTHGVPVVPGYDGPDDREALIREAARIGFPVMLKARGGGGGRGMREVLTAGDLPDAIESARREALAAFGDAGLLLEKLVTGAHHVEVQVLADSYGSVVHLGERDCSIQRRHQKLIEETPSPAVDDTLRERLTNYALTLARAINYVNAGTFEFLVVLRASSQASTAGDEVYFLEVNPRLQVEHPVTEMVTGLDLVELQLRVAAGEPLPFQQDDVTFSGHAIELRVNAEDPWDAFSPGSGRLRMLRSHASRTDSGYEQGDTVPSQYDSLVLKQVFHSTTRSDAIARAGVVWPADVEGIRSNLGLLKAIIQHPDFAAGVCTTDWLEQNLDALLDSARHSPREWIAAAVVLSRITGGSHAPVIWLGAGHPQLWLNDGIETRRVQLSASPASPARGTARLDGLAYEFTLPGGALSVGKHGPQETILIRADGDLQPVSVEVPGNFFLVPPPPLPRRIHAAAVGSTAVTAPLAGTIAAVRVAEGDLVAEGQVLVVLEAMKMEHRITAPAAGTIKAVPVRERDVVHDGDLLVELA